MDSLSLESKTTRVTQREVIIQAISQAKHPMTKQEIANRLKSKSLGHANTYLDMMMKDGEIVRVGHMTYTTPEKAFNDIDINKIMLLVKKIIDSTSKIIEVDLIRQYLNKELSFSFSKYFYSSLISANISSYSWYKVNNLISVNKIPYANLADLFRKSCNYSLFDADNMKIIREIILLTDTVAERALYMWRHDNI